MLINTIENIAFKAIDVGVRIPGWSYLEKYSQWSQLKLLLDKLQVNCVIDVGANRGQFGRSLRRTGYSGLICSFEPSNQDFEILLRKSSQDPHWKAFNLALGSKNESKEFHISQASVFNSFLDPSVGIDSFDESGMSIVRTESVEVKRLDEIFDSLVVSIEQPRVFLKMDTQGYDLEVICGTEGCLTSIAGLQSELSVVPIYENMPSYLESLSQYQNYGFKLVNLFVVNRTKRGEILEYDAVFMR